MYDKRTEQAAARLGILRRMQRLEEDILTYSRLTISCASSLTSATIPKSPM